MAGCVLMRDTGLVKGEILVLTHIISCPPMAVWVNSYPAGIDLVKQPAAPGPSKAPEQRRTLLGSFHHESTSLTGYAHTQDCGWFCHCVRCNLDEECPDCERKQNLGRVHTSIFLHMSPLPCPLPRPGDKFREAKQSDQGCTASGWQS
jgi:hypothetical protein